MDQGGAQALRFLGENAGGDAVDRQRELRLEFGPVHGSVGTALTIRSGFASRTARRMASGSDRSISALPGVVTCPSLAKRRSSSNPTWPLVPVIRMRPNATSKYCHSE